MTQELVNIPINLLVYKPQQKTTALCWQISPESLVSLEAIDFEVEVDVVVDFSSINKKVYTKDNIVNYQDGKFFKAFVIDDPLLFETQKYYWRVRVNCDDYISYWSDFQKQDIDTFLNNLEYNVPAKIKYVDSGEETTVAIQKTYEARYIVDAVYYTEDELINKIQTDYGSDKRVFLGKLEYDKDIKVNIEKVETVNDEIVVTPTGDTIEIRMVKLSKFAFGDAPDTTYTLADFKEELETEYGITDNVYEYVGPYEFDINKITWYDDTELAERLLPDNYVYTKSGNTNIKRIIEMYMRLIGIAKNEVIQVANNFNYKKIQDADLYDLLGILLTYTRNTEEPFVTYKYELLNLWQAYLHQGTEEAFNIIIETFFGVKPTINILKSSLEKTWYVFNQMQLLSVNGATPAALNISKGDAFYNADLDKVLIATHGSTTGDWSGAYEQEPNEMTTYQLMGSGNLTNYMYVGTSTAMYEGTPDVERYYVREIQDTEEIYFQSEYLNPFLYTNQYLAHNLVIKVENVYNVEIDQKILLEILNSLKPLNVNIILDIQNPYNRKTVEFTVVDASDNEIDITSNSSFSYRAIKGYIVSIEGNKVIVTEGTSILCYVSSNGYERAVAQIDNITEDANETIKAEPIYKGLKFEAIEDAGTTITATYTSLGGYSDPDLKYRKKGEEWTTWTVGTTISLDKDDFLCVKGDNSSGWTHDSSNVVFKLTPSNKTMVSGNINSLLDDGDGSTVSTLPCDYCYQYLFSDSAIVSVPLLPATTLTQGCYTGMFKGCTNININTQSYYSDGTKANGLSLRATTIPQESYKQMFKDCSATITLSSSTIITAATLGTSSCEEMFSGNANISIDSSYVSFITTVGASSCKSMFANCDTVTINNMFLSATTLAANCYESMFADCDTVNINVNLLPATTLAEYCYAHMFENSDVLLSPSFELPAETMANYCYASMFRNTTIDSAPNIYAITLASGCFNTMFENCSNLSSITLVNFTDNFNSNYFYSWVANVAASGIMYYKGTDITESVSAIPIGWVYQNTDFTGLTFMAEQAGSKIKYTVSNITPNIEYSTDAETWTTWEADTEITLDNTGTTLFVRGNNPNGIGRGNKDTNNGYMRFVMEGQIAATGNINSLIDPEDFDSITTIPGNNSSGYSWCYYSLFMDCTALTTPPQLPATSLYSHCYRSLFNGCTNLKKAPVLPAEDLATSCYQLMFRRCTSLETAPELPLTDVTLYSNCYYGMFRECTALVNPPSVLSKVSVSSNNGYYAYMFYGCTSLEKAPEIMAEGGSANTHFQYMFYGCSSLNYIKIHWSHMRTFNANSWVYGVAASGDFYYKNGGAPGVNYNDNCVPSGWTVHTF